MNFTKEEFKFYYDDLKVKAVIIEENKLIQAREAAEAAKKLAEENEARWKAQEEERKAKEKEVVHVTSSKYAQEAEDKVDAADEGAGRRRKKKKAADKNARGARNARGGKKATSEVQKPKENARRAGYMVSALA